ncbi:type 1 glutamine amidotransferase [candidate division TA06 bacterium]|nr:type 1 glutamine amidotransferase [candidate division TA06 bacterium]
MNETLKGRRVLILVEDLYQELEVWYPYYRLKEEGAEVIFVGTGRSKHYKGKHGYPLEEEKRVDEVIDESYDAVVIPGGYAPDLMRRCEAMVRLVKEAHERGKVVAAICHGGWMLASSGILQGKTVTCFSAIKDDLIHAGAKYVDQEVVVNGKLITSRKPDDLPVFCVELIKALA